MYANHYIKHKTVCNVGRSELTSEYVQNFIFLYMHNYSGQIMHSYDILFQSPPTPAGLSRVSPYISETLVHPGHYFTVSPPRPRT